MSRIETQYEERTVRSAELAQIAERFMPGGDTRAAAYFPPHPVTIARGQGPYRRAVLPSASVSAARRTRD